MYNKLTDVHGAGLDYYQTKLAIDSCLDYISSLFDNEFDSKRLHGVRVLFSKELKYDSYKIKKNNIFSWAQHLADNGHGERKDDYYGGKSGNWPIELDPFREEEMEGEFPGTKFPGVLIDNINGSQVIQHLILGEFYSKSMTIVLYVDAIKQHSHACGYNEEMVLNGTFAHEFFHAYHYCACLHDKRYTKQNWNNRTNYASIVKESLASWFEYWFFEKNHETQIMSDKRHFWYRIDVNDYPYSGALGLLPCCTRGINKPNAVQDVFNDSLWSWRYAAEEIVGLYRSIHMG